MNIKSTYVRIHWFLSTQCGFDFLILFRSAKGLPRYVAGLIKFRSKYIGRMELQPCLNDWYAEGGSTKNEYFWQDLLVAQKIFDANPKRHVDIGSRVDGFVAHVASFREIEVFDVRATTAKIPNIVFKQADLMSPLPDLNSYCDSLSCLHALEHFGLGRYGDPINPNGWRDGLANMANLLSENGVFYLSTPIGSQRVVFNANYIFDPRLVIKTALSHSLNLTALVVIKQNGEISQVNHNELTLADLAEDSYALGLFVFVKAE